MGEELSELQKIERQAMTGDRAAVIAVVSALRRYREASRKLLGARYRDGECDAVSLSTFESGIGEIEEMEG